MLYLEKSLSFAAWFVQSTEIFWSVRSKIVLLITISCVIAVTISVRVIEDNPRTILVRNASLSHHLSITDISSINILICHSREVKTFKSRVQVPYIFAQTSTFLMSTHLSLIIISLSTLVRIFVVSVHLRAPVIFFLRSVKVSPHWASSWW